MGEGKRRPETSALGRVLGHCLNTFWITAMQRVGKKAREALFKSLAEPCNATWRGKPHVQLCGGHLVQKRSGSCEEPPRQQRAQGPFQTLLVLKKVTPEHPRVAPLGPCSALPRLVDEELSESSLAERPGFVF